METQTVAGMVAVAKSRIDNLDVAAVDAEMGEGNPILVDIREPEERSASGTIPGSIHAPRGMLEFYADATSPYHRPEFDTDRRIILYCASGGRSALATDALQRLGYTNIAHLDGGIKAWIAAGKPAESV
jgi:rhodanese-related sulfurtransferase